MKTRIRHPLLYKNYWTAIGMEFLSEEPITGAIHFIRLFNLESFRRRAGFFQRSGRCHYGNHSSAFVFHSFICRCFGRPLRIQEHAYGCFYLPYVRLFSNRLHEFLRFGVCLAHYHGHRSRIVQTGYFRNHSPQYDRKNSTLGFGIFIGPSI